MSSFVCVRGRVEEVVGAEVVVELAGGEHVPDRDRIECLTAPIALLCPRLSAGVLSGEVGVAGAGRGDSGFFQRQVQPFEPLRVLPDRRLPADWSLPGHIPAHDARCLSVGNTVMSSPISRRSLPRFAADPGDRAQQVTGRL